MIASHAWAKSTAKKVELAFRRWSEWCKTVGQDRLRPSAVLLVNWLADEFGQNNYQWTWFAQQASGLSTKFSWLGQRLGHSVVVADFLKAIKKLRPSRPRYVDFFDPGELTEPLLEMGPNASLEWPLLAGKLVVLLYATGLRGADMARVSLEHSKLDRVDHKLVLVTKTKEASEGQWVTQEVDPWLDEPDLCPHCVARELLSRAREGVVPKSLFYNQRTGDPVSADWLRNLAHRVMDKAGVDPAYTPHALRGAGATKALGQGVPEPAVRHAFRWVQGSKSMDNCYNRLKSDESLVKLIFSRKTAALTPAGNSSGKRTPKKRGRKAL